MSFVLNKRSDGNWRGSWGAIEFTTSHCPPGLQRCLMMSARERRSWAEQPGPQTRVEWFAAMSAAKTLAIRKMGGHARQYQVAHHPSGRPVLVRLGRRTPLHLSLSRRAGLGCAALGPVPLGIDIEQATSDDRDIISMLASPGEFDMIQHFCDYLHTPVSSVVLCIKESVLKCLGLAITKPRYQVVLREVRTSGSSHPKVGGFSVESLSNGIFFQGFLARLDDHILSVSTVTGFNCLTL